MKIMEATPKFLKKGCTYAAHSVTSKHECATRPVLPKGQRQWMLKREMDDSNEIGYKTLLRIGSNSPGHPATNPVVDAVVPCLDSDGFDFVVEVVVVALLDLEWPAQH